MASAKSGRSSSRSAESALKRALRRKEAARKKLARLPIEEKVNIVALLQRRANEVRRAAGRPEKPEWPLNPEYT